MYQGGTVKRREREREGMLGPLLKHLPFVRSGLLDWPVHKCNVILTLRKLVWSNWSTFLNSLARSSYSSICGLADGARNQVWLMVSASSLCLEFSPLNK